MAGGPQIESTYRELLQLARRRGYAVGASGAEAVDKVFTEALNAIAMRMQGASGPLADHLERARRELRVIWQQLEGRLVNTMETGVSLTIEEVLSVHRGFLSELGGELGISNLASRLSGANTAALSVVLSRGGTASLIKSLTRYSMGNALEDVDRFLARAALQGISAGQATQDLAQMMGGTDLLRHWHKLPSASRLQKGDLGRLDLRRYGFDESEFPAARKLLFDARRIGVSEQNNALREVSRQATSRAGLVSAVAWQRSGLHEGLSSTPCECDVLAESDTYGLGRGYYPPNKFPDAPHPICACCQGAVKARRPSEWDMPLPDRQPTQGAGQSIEAAAKRLGREGGLTDGAVARMARSSRGAIISGGAKPLEVPGRIQAATGAFKLSASAMAKTPPRPKAPVQATPELAPAWDIGGDPSIPTERNVFKSDPAPRVRAAIGEWVQGKGTPQNVEELSHKIASAFNVGVTGNRDVYALGPDVQQVKLAFLSPSHDAAEFSGVLGFYQKNGGKIGLSDEVIEGLERFVGLLGKAKTPAELSQLLLADAKAVQGTQLAAGKAFHTLTHELHHVLSITQAGSYGSAWGKLVEESLVEVLARRNVQKALNVQVPTLGGTVATHFSTSYQSYVDTLNYWLERKGGDATLEELWTVRTDGLRADFFKRWVSEDWTALSQRMEAAGLPRLPPIDLPDVTGARHFVPANNEAVLEGAHELSASTRAADHLIKEIDRDGILKDNLSNEAAIRALAKSYRKLLPDASLYIGQWEKQVLAMLGR